MAAVDHFLNEQHLFSFPFVLSTSYFLSLCTGPLYKGYLLKLPIVFVNLNCKRCLFHCKMYLFNCEMYLFFVDPTSSPVRATNRKGVVTFAAN